VQVEVEAEEEEEAAGKVEKVEFDDVAITIIELVRARRSSCSSTAGDAAFAVGAIMRSFFPSLSGERERERELKESTRARGGEDRSKRERGCEKKNRTLCFSSHCASKHLDITFPTSSILHLSLPLSLSSHL
jgi:hypothetical protein